MREIYVNGISCSNVSRSKSDLKYVACQVARDALLEADMTMDDIEFVLFSNTSGGLLQNQESIRGQSWLQDINVGGIPLINVENACNSGGSAFFLGCELAKRIDGAVLVVGAEGMNVGSRDRTLAAIESCIPSTERRVLIENTRGSAPSVFMYKNQEWANELVNSGSYTWRQLASVTVKSREFAFHNSIAQSREKVTLDQVLESPVVSGSLTRLMCSSFSDGAAACVISSAAKPGSIQVAANNLTTGDGSLLWHDRIKSSGDAVFKMAGLSRSEIDVLETHDATVVEELFALETLGFFPKGTAGFETESGRTGIGGDFLVNSSGGLISRGHPMGATGIYQVMEIVQQLRGDCGARQSATARIGMTLNVGGYISGDAASVSSHILVKP